MKVLHILVDGEEAAILRCSGEQDTGVATFNRVFLRRRSVVIGGVNLLDVANRPGLEQRAVQIEWSSSCSSLGSALSFGLGSRSGLGLRSLSLSCLSLSFGIFSLVVREETSWGVEESRWLLGSGKKSSLLEGLENSGRNHLY